MLWPPQPYQDSSSEGSQHKIFRRINKNMDSSQILYFGSSGLFRQTDVEIGILYLIKLMLIVVDLFQNCA